MTADMTADGLPPGRRGAAVVCIAVGICMTVLDATMVNVALPSIARDLDIPPATATWVVNAYQLAMLGLLLPFASLGEVMGFRRVYQAGLCVFLLGALGSAMAPGLELLLASRVLQGIGAAAVMSLTAGLVRHTYPASQLGRAIGINAFTVAMSSATGPSIGALIITVAGWPAIFFGALPIGLGVLLVGARLLPEVAPQPRRFDALGALLNLASFACLFLGVDMLLVAPFLAVPLLALAAISFTLLFRLQRGQPAPLLPLDLLRIVTVRLSVLASACMFSAQAMVYVSLPFLLTAAGRSVAEIGLMISPWPAAIALAAPFAGRLSDRVTATWPCALGAVAVAAGLLTVALLPPDGAKLPIMLALFVCGFGFGAFQAPNNRNILASAPKSRAGSAGGLQATARVLGQAAGTTVVAMVFHFGAQEAGSRAAAAALFVASAVAMVAAGATMVRQRVR